MPVSAASALYRHYRRGQWCDGGESFVAARQRFELYLYPAFSVGCSEANRPKSERGGQNPPFFFRGRTILRIPRASWRPGRCEEFPVPLVSAKLAASRSHRNLYLAKSLPHGRRTSCAT